MTQTAETGRRARKKSRTHQAIFDAAAKLSRTAGFDALTVQAICAEADIARGTFFLHFANKAALLAETERALVMRLRSQSLGRDPRAGARSWLDGLAEAWPSHAGLLQPMLGALLAGASGGDGALLALLEDRVREGQRGGLRRDVEPSQIARLWLATAASVFAGPSVPSAAEREQALSLLQRGQAATKPRLKWAPPATTAAH